MNAPTATATDPGADWTAASIPELIDHIVAHRHLPLREELRRVGTLIRQSAVFPATAEARDFARRFVAFARDILRHLDHEERALFPLCRALDEAFHHHGREAVDAGDAIHHMSLGHGEAARDLDHLARAARALPDGNKPLITAAVREAIATMAVELAQHSREEEEILLPAVIFEQEVVASRRTFALDPGRAP